MIVDVVLEKCCIDLMRQLSKTRDTIVFIRVTGILGDHLDQVRWNNSARVREIADFSSVLLQDVPGDRSVRRSARPDILAGVVKFYRWVNTASRSSVSHNHNCYNCRTRIEIILIDP